MVKTRLFLCIFLAAVGGNAFAGIYQRARYTHAKVWNDQPKSFQEVQWSGGKDAAGYATGYGTLTWYAPEKPPTTGSNIPTRRRMVVTGTYSGTMVRGKFVGPTTIGKVAQTNPSPAARTKRVPSRSSTPSPAAEKPSVNAKATPAPTASPAASPAAASAPSATGTPTSDSLNSLTRPPPSLNLNTPPEASPSPQASASPSP